MADDGWSRAFMAASGVPVSSERSDNGLRAVVNEARSDALPTPRIIELADHRAPEVREAIAARRDCPLGMQASLAHDRRPSVRIALASGAGLAGAVAATLAEDRDISVLKALARNQKVPRAVLDLLATHRRADVARLARRTLDGVVLGDDPAHGRSTREIEERAASPLGAQHGPETGTAGAGASPVGDRAVRTLAPRPRPLPRQDGARPRQDGAGREQP